MKICVFICVLCSLCSQSELEPINTCECWLYTFHLETKPDVVGCYGRFVQCDRCTCIVYMKFFWGGFCLHHCILRPLLQAMLKWLQKCAPARLCACADYQQKLVSLCRSNTPWCYLWSISRFHSTFIFMRNAVRRVRFRLWVDLPSWQNIWK